MVFSLVVVMQWHIVLFAEMVFNVMIAIIFFCVAMILAHGCTIEDRAKLRPLGLALWDIGNSVKPRVEITKRVFS